MSNKIAITDIVNRLESDMLLLTKQELLWQGRVMINKFKDKLDDLNEIYGEGITAHIILEDLKDFLNKEYNDE